MPRLAKESQGLLQYLSQWDSIMKQPARELYWLSCGNFLTLDVSAAQYCVLFFSARTSQGFGDESGLQPHGAANTELNGRDPMLKPDNQFNVVRQVFPIAREIRMALPFQAESHIRSTRDHGSDTFHPTRTLPP